MNRRERRHMQKQLDLHKFYKTQTREQRWDRIRENQENGKRMMEENTENVRIAQQEAAQQKESDIISRIAEEIAENKKIPLIDAMVEAQEEYQNMKA